MSLIFCSAGVGTDVVSGEEVGAASAKVESQEFDLHCYYLLLFFDTFFLKKKIIEKWYSFYLEILSCRLNIFLTFFASFFIRYVINKQVLIKEIQLHLMQKSINPFSFFAVVLGNADPSFSLSFSFPMPRDYYWMIKRNKNK